MSKNLSTGTVMLSVLLALLLTGIWYESHAIMRLGKLQPTGQASHRDRMTFLARRLKEVEADRSTADAKLRETSLAKQSGGQQKVVMVDLDRYPELGALIARQQRLQIIAQYGKVLNSLGLPADKLAKVKELLTDRAASIQVAEQAAIRLGFAEGSLRYREIVSQAAATPESEMRTVLGQEDYDRFGNAARADMAKQLIIRNEGGDMQDAGVPLTSEQTLALAKIEADYQMLYDESPGDSRIRAMLAESPDPQTGLGPADKALIDRASQILSPEQLQILRQSRLDHAKLASLRSSAMERAQAAIGAGSP
jgi:hypothetical protein